MSAKGMAKARVSPPIQPMASQALSLLMGQVAIKPKNRPIPAPNFIPMETHQKNWE